ncbi:hypothetical protein Ahy_A06g029545 [Arachis hypogaea]|uniref:Uncharacterized protein n=1 Tax=Arachis hypogaea TaxID=3818 RepID=A0A445CTP2_ARAHY|nr:hypothetical protein Ahy_A06g029545 [Arachis hypogaea]
MLEDIRLCSKIKKAPLVHWETDEGFSHRRLTNKANRTSARSSKYIGGSATFMNTKSKSLDRDATLSETFKYTHILKENKRDLLIRGLRIIICCTNHYNMCYIGVLYVNTRARDSEILAKWRGRRWLCYFNCQSQCGLARDRLSVIQDLCIRDGVVLHK